MGYDAYADLMGQPKPDMKQPLVGAAIGYIVGTWVGNKLDAFFARRKAS